jgi:probable aminopeptidase NPEPL1
VALVGKGITYDTGGLALKVGGVMVGMKADMAGAAACLGAFRMLVAGGLDRPLSLLLPMAENSIGRHAYRNDDILRMHSGKTVEINNTDAEGRLLLADAVSWAARVLGAATILDAATLTGAQLVATGKVVAAVMSNDEALESHAIAAGRATGDHVHPLIFAPELFKPEFRSKVADMTNSVADRTNAPSSAAGQFIYNHLDGLDVQWAHVDLAGPAFPDGRATGFGAHLLAALVRRLTSA